MKKINMFTQEDMLVVDKNIKPETCIENVLALLSDIDDYDTPNDINQKVEESNIDFGMIFDNKQERKEIIRNLKNELSIWSKAGSVYFELKSILKDENSSLDILGSRKICAYINAILQYQTSDFANAIREVGIQLSREELLASNSDEVNEYIGNSEERKLENEINQLLLNHDIEMAYTEIQISNKYNQLKQLDIHNRNGKITPDEWSRQKPIISLEIDSNILKQEICTHFTNYETGIRRYQINEHTIDIQSIAKEVHAYELTHLEQKRILNKIDLKNKNITIQDYQEKEELIKEAVKNENNRHANYTKIFLRK